MPGTELTLQRFVWWITIGLEEILRSYKGRRATTSYVTVFGPQYPIDQIGDCILGPIAGLFDDLICAQLHFLSLHRSSIPCNIVLNANIEFCGTFAGPGAASLCSVVPIATGATR